MRVDNDTLAIFKASAEWAAAIIKH
jgi:hypothetical protein